MNIFKKLLRKELGEKRWPHHYLDRFHYVYPNDEMANDVINITTLDEWIALEKNRTSGARN